MQFEYSVDETPFRFVFSFETLIERMVNLAKTDSLYASKYGGILDEAKRYPELLHEVDYQYLAENHEFLKKLLDDIFPPSLTDNEIKAVSMPYANFLYNPTRRLVKILEGAGSDFELKFINISPDEFYIMCCCFILSAYFKTPVRADIPFIYSIPNAEGYLNHYRVLTNGDFLQIIPTENAKMLSKEEIAQLSDRFYDVELWKEKIPPHSWEVRGFGVVNFYDATTEVAISNLKGLHIKSQNIVSAIPEDLNETFRSIFRSSGIMVGCTEIDPNKKIAKESPINFAIDGYLLKSSDQPAIIDTDVIETLMRKQYFSISDIDRYLTEHPYSWVAQHFATLGFKSIILAPIFRDGQLISVIEVCSPKKFLNSVNAHKLDSILPFLEDSVNQVYTNLDNRIAAIIQREYTAIHPSVYWKFRQAAIKHLGYNLGNRIDQMPQQNISFHEVLPHYGQSDVKNSSEIRNKAILKDLTEQLTQLHSLLRSLEKSKIQQQIITKTEAKLQRLRGGLRADTENEIQRYLVKEVKPVLEKLKYESTTTNAKITAFLNADSSSSFRNRKRFDDSIGTVNKQLSDLVDRRQEEQQEKFPFYYERYTTDGVEHNLYIGKQIAPWLSFDPIYVKNLRLWQLRLMIECELHFQHIKRELPVELEITSLILAYHSEISIRFRLDEKRFDVDGSYNARYEIIKKRIDKALIKDTNERLVKSGYLSIVYAQQHQYQEYLQFLEILRDENLITGNPECLELESLQGITGLKALRIPINFSAEAVDYTFIEEF